MDSFKIKLYEQEYNKPFPSFKHLTNFKSLSNSAMDIQNQTGNDE